MRKFTIPLYTIVFLILVNLVPLRTIAAQDSLPIGGKGMYLWKLWTSESGGKNLNTIIEKLKFAGVTWIVIKMADGDSYYNRSGKDLYNWASANYGSMDSVVSVFHYNGIKLLAFQYVYGEPHHWGNPVSETDVANSILDVKGLDGLLIDAEIEYDKLATRVAAAQAYCDSIHAHHPEAFIGLTAWARINGHNTFPWTTFLDRVEVNMPQTYWAARPTTPQNELSIMSSQFTSYTKTWVSQGDSAADKPIMPLGQGEYFGYSNDVKQGDITSFCDLSQTTYNYPGVSLWEYNQIDQPYIWNEYISAWQLTSVAEDLKTPIQFNLSQNYPNPFNPTTKIKYTVAPPNLPKGEALVQLRIYDILGNEIATLVNKEQTPGEYEVEFDAGKYNLSSGIYFYRLAINSDQLKTGSIVQTKKLVLLK